MVLPLFVIETLETTSIGSILRLDGSEGKHAVSVRRMRTGEGIQITNGRGLRVMGSVSELGDKWLSLVVREVQNEDQIAPRMTLVQALAKGDRDELAVQAATELGVSLVIPWQADRSVSRWEGAKVAKGVERWQTIANEAAKQALRAHFPSVGLPVTTKGLLEYVKGAGLVLVLDPTAHTPISKVELAAQAEVAIVVGPEGGISDGELELLERAGAMRVRLGTEILRTSTAGVAAISAILTKLDRW